MHEWTNCPIALEGVDDNGDDAAPCDHIPPRGDVYQVVLQSACACHPQHS